MLIVLALTVFWDLIVAVAVGMVLASLIYVKNMADYQLAALRIARRKDEARVTPEEAEILDSADGRIALVQPAGPLNFGGATALGRRLAESGKFDALVLDLTDVPIVDGSVALALEDLFRQAAQLGRPAFICGVQSAVAAVLDRLGAVPPAGTQARAPDRMSALRLAAAALVERQRAGHMPGGLD
jgi:SulP family sulfate permease